MLYLEVAWEVEYTDEFEEWWHTLSESEQGKVDARVGLLRVGPMIGTRAESRVSIQFAGQDIPLPGNAGTARASRG